MRFELGTLARHRGDYATAEQHYQAALAIFEETGDRADIARTYHQLGILAQDRGDYATAEDRYQAALAISEEMGDQASIARTLSQLGVLRTDQDRLADAISYQVQCLAIHTKLNSSAAAADVGMLRKQRAALGEQQFQSVLRTLISNDDIVAILQLIEQSG
jgi:tetratricopeptide (TPR) repeat protein